MTHRRYWVWFSESEPKSAKYYKKLFEWTNDNRVLMTGPAELEFEGVLAADILSRTQV